jgi:hypothetical protein
VQSTFGSESEFTITVPSLVLTENSLSFSSESLVQTHYSRTYTASLQSFDDNTTFSTLFEIDFETSITLDAKLLSTTRDQSSAADNSNITPNEGGSPTRSLTPLESRSRKPFSTEFLAPAATPTASHAIFATESRPLTQTKGSSGIPVRTLLSRSRTKSVTPSESRSPLKSQLPGPFPSETESQDPFSNESEVSDDLEEPLDNFSVSMSLSETGIETVSLTESRSKVTSRALRSRSRTRSFASTIVLRSSPRSTSSGIQRETSEFDITLLFSDSGSGGFSDSGSIPQSYFIDGGGARAKTVEKKMSVTGYVLGIALMLVVGVVFMVRDFQMEYDLAKHRKVNSMLKFVAKVKGIRAKQKEEEEVYRDHQDTVMEEDTFLISEYS